MECKEELNVIFSEAILQIAQFNIDERTELNYTNRILPYYVLSYIKEGTCRVRFQGEDYYAQPGDVVFLPPNIRHDHVKDTNEKTTFMWWHFNFKLANCIEVLKMFQFPILFHIKSPLAFEVVFSQYATYAKHTNSIQAVILKQAKALELIAMLIDDAIGNEGLELNNDYYLQFSKVLIDIVKHPESESSLETLAEKYHMHPTYISNRFKLLFGVSPMQLKRHVRLNKAKVLLQKENLSIGQIAKAVGYEDQDDFARFFKSQMGISASNFRNSFRKSNIEI